MQISRIGNQTNTINNNKNNSPSFGAIIWPKQIITEGTNVNDNHGFLAGRLLDCLRVALVTKGVGFPKGEHICKVIEEATGEKNIPTTVLYFTKKFRCLLTGDEVQAWKAKTKPLIDAKLSEEELTPKFDAIIQELKDTPGVKNVDLAIQTKTSTRTSYDERSVGIFAKSYLDDIEISK